MEFKTCTSCKHVWETRDAFLADPCVRVIGYQVNYGELNAGLFLFQHNIPKCGTCLAIEAGEFTDLHEGPIFSVNLHGTDDCPQYCLDKHNLDPCSNPCECAFVRDVLQAVKNWPKREIEA